MTVPGAVGSGLPQRWQVRSPGGLATPQASLMQRLGGPSATAPISPVIRKPQSMQAMAPSSSGDLQAGQTFLAPGAVAVVPAVAVAGLGGGGAGREGGGAGAGRDDGPPAP